MILDLVGFIFTHFQPKPSHGGPFQAKFYQALISIRLISIRQSVVHFDMAVCPRITPRILFYTRGAAAHIILTIPRIYIKSSGRRTHNTAHNDLTARGRRAYSSRLCPTLSSPHNGPKPYKVDRNCRIGTQHLDLDRMI